MTHSFTSVPEGYRAIYTVDLQKDKKTALLINGTAMLAMIVMAVGMHFIVPFWTVFEGLEDDLRPMLVKLAVMGVGYVAYIILHELTHAAVMKHFGAEKVRFGFTGLYAFAGSECDYYDRHAYLRIALAPLIVWGVVFLVLSLIVPVGWYWIVWFWQIGNVSGSAGDVFVTIKFSSMPKDILVRDTGIGMEVFSAH